MERGEPGSKIPSRNTNRGNCRSTAVRPEFRCGLYRENQEGVRGAKGIKAL